jgi:hypothetical protein
MNSMWRNHGSLLPWLKSNLSSRPESGLVSISVLGLEDGADAFAGCANIDTCKEVLIH